MLSWPDAFEPIVTPLEVNPTRIVPTVMVRIHAMIVHSPAFEIELERVSAAVPPRSVIRRPQRGRIHAASELALVDVEATGFSVLSAPVSVDAELAVLASGCVCVNAPVNVLALDGVAAIGFSVLSVPVSVLALDPVPTSSGFSG